MTEIPDSLRSVFTAQIEDSGAEYVVSIPEGEIEHDGLTPGESYRVAVFEPAGAQDSKQTGSPRASTTRRRPPRAEPPVEVDDLVEVEIESIGDEGDGIAKVDRGYVIIVPDGQPGDTLTVRIEEVKENVAFAEIHH